MRETHSSQFSCACVLVEADDTDPEEIIEYAESIGATTTDGEEDGDEEVLVLEWPMAGRSVGPELYTKDAVRRGCASREASNG